MKITSNLIDAIISIERAKCILPALMALTLVTAFLGVTGCSPPHH